MFYTREDLDYTQMFLSVRNEESVVFRVKACRGVRLALTQYEGRGTKSFIFLLLFKTCPKTLKPSPLPLPFVPGLVDHLAFEVLFGNFDDSRSVIRNCVGPGCTIQAEKATPGILNCDQMVYLWLAWDHRTISIGK